MTLTDKIYQKVIDPALDWFQEARFSKKTVKIGSNEIVVRAFTFDLIVSVLILSVLINLFLLSSWILYQVDPASRESIVKIFFR